MLRSRILTILVAWVVASASSLSHQPVASFGTRGLLPHHMCIHTGINTCAGMRKETSKRIAHSPTSVNAQETGDSVPTWCPDQQIYIGGVVPDNSHLERLLAENGGALRIFGYGSLCWNPGSGDVLSRKCDGVSTTLGRAVGWKRCWAQRSADHRGTPTFPGLVCSLLTDQEVAEILCAETGVTQSPPPSSLTEGLIYTVPSELVKDCLSELDFREKGGYERDVIDVIEDNTGKIVHALLYRGTPANPAFWNRAMLDLPFASAIIAVSIGPSGKNSDYLYNLDNFLANVSTTSPATNSVFDNYTGDTDTMDLASMTRLLQEQKLYFMFGSGSNQHNQLLLSSTANGAGLVNGDIARDLKEIVLVTPSVSTGGECATPCRTPKQIFCGGGHSALLEEGGNLYLWGWNNHGQLGRANNADTTQIGNAFPVIAPLCGIQVESAALGHFHTLAIERETGALYAFGNNSHGQLDGRVGNDIVSTPTRVHLSDGESCIEAAAGLLHSAVITTNGELVTFGCRRFGQCSSNFQSNPQSGDRYHSKVAIERWHPADGSRLIKVVCGHKHTAVLDEHGRVWTMGNNKYGQLGVKASSMSGSAQMLPQLVDGPLGQKESGCFDIDCGWSHIFALVKNKDVTTDSSIYLYGWGRNDMGQLGTGSVENISTPRIIHKRVGGGIIQSLSCGSESTIISDEYGRIWGTGWNEHGTTSTGKSKVACNFAELVGVRRTSPSPTDGKGGNIMAAGAAHFLIMTKKQ